MSARTRQQSTPSSRHTLRWLALIAIVFITVGIAGWRWSSPPVSPIIAAPPAFVDTLMPGIVATLDSPPFVDDAGWTITSAGADPGEPVDPWTQPAGVLTFQYTGVDLFLQLALGDYWGYLYITVDGEPANRLPLISGNSNAQGVAAGYRTFYAPELQTDRGTTPQWVLVHHAPDPNQSHEVRVEVWRSWGQTPLRAVAIDAQTSPALPRWPFVALIILGIGILLFSLHSSKITATRIPGCVPVGNLLFFLTQPVQNASVRRIVALLGFLLIAGAILLRAWWLAPLGLALLAYASLRQPVLWAAALLFALPFYYSQTLPILPTRATNLIDVGVLGGVVIAIGAWLIAQRLPILPPTPTRHWPMLAWILALTGWALVAAAAAPYGDVALREWRTVFLAASLFALLLNACRRDPDAPLLLLLAWIAGGVVIALIGLSQFATDAMLIEAEGVHRVRSLYGSPNNLALYLERTLMPTLAWLLLMPNGTRRWLALAAAVIQGGVLLLTFSKGALILGLPAGLVTLWLGGLYLLRRHQSSTRPLWWLAAAAAVALLALLPFLGTERFQRLLDFNSGTGFTRLQLWRSALQMALDHPWLGIGPDNFLYAYRSQYILPAAWQEPNLNHPHNWLLDWWTRLGLPGVFLGLGWWFGGLRATWQRLRQLSPTAAHAALWLGSLAAIAAALSHGLIDLSYAVPDLMLVWVSLTIVPTLSAEPSTQKAT